MSPRDEVMRLRDIAAAVSAIQRHLARGSIEDELVFDACRVRLIEIGEAVKDLDADLVTHAPNVPWREIAWMRDHLTHRYFDVQREIVADVVSNDLVPLGQGVARLLVHLGANSTDQTQMSIGGDDSARTGQRSA